MNKIYNIPWKFEFNLMYLKRDITVWKKKKNNYEEFLSESVQGLQLKTEDLKYQQIWYFIFYNIQSNVC